MKFRRKNPFLLKKEGLFYGLCAIYEKIGQKYQNSLGILVYLRRARDLIFMYTIVYTYEWDRI